MVIETSKFMFKVCKVLQTFTEKLGHAVFKKRGGKGMALQSALSRLRTAANSQSLPPTERRLNNHVVSAVRKHSLLEHSLPLQSDGLYLELVILNFAEACCSGCNISFQFGRHRKGCF